jgi:hypothetical protein
VSLEITNSYAQRHVPVLDISDQDADPLKPVAMHGYLLPGNSGKPAHVSRMIRLITQGVKRRDGSRLRLQAIRGPGCWLSRKSWVIAFLEEITSDRMAAIDARSTSAEPKVNGQRTEADRRRAADAAMKAIAELV